MKKKIQFIIYFFLNIFIFTAEKNEDDRQNPVRFLDSAQQKSKGK